MTFLGKINFNYVYIESSYNTLLQWFCNVEGDILLWENKNSATCCSIQVTRRETEEHE